MKTPFPWYSERRSGGGWFVKLEGGQKFLGKHTNDAPKPRKGKDGRWNPPSAILDEFYKLMALRDTALKSDYTFDTICALYLRELEETNPDLAKRYEQTLLQLCRFPYREKSVGKLLVNAELEGIHLRKWAETFPSDQTQRTYINCCKAVLTWAVRKKGINISHNPFLSVKSPKMRAGLSSSAGTNTRRCLNSGTTTVTVISSRRCGSPAHYPERSPRSRRGT